MGPQADTVLFLKFQWSYYLVVCYYRLYLIKTSRVTHTLVDLRGCRFLCIVGWRSWDTRLPCGHDRCHRWRVQASLNISELHLAGLHKGQILCLSFEEDIFRSAKMPGDAGLFCRGVHRRDEQLEARWMLSLQCCPFLHRLYKRERGGLGVSLPHLIGCVCVFVFHLVQGVGESAWTPVSVPAGKSSNSLCYNCPLGTGPHTKINESEWMSVTLPPFCLLLH